MIWRYVCSYAHSTPGADPGPGRGCLAQFDPADAEVISYYPHVTDGGPVDQRWITSMTFVNPHGTASGRVYLYGDNGKPLFLDFGNGPVSSLYFAIPLQGTIEFQVHRRRLQWRQRAMVTSTLTVKGVFRIRFSTNRVPEQGAAEHTTKAPTLFRVPETAFAGVAVANVS